MKRLLQACLLMAAICSSTQSFAQIGVRGGVMLSNIGRGDIEDNFDAYKDNFALGGMAGVMGDINLGSVLAITPEVYWIQKGGQAKFTLLGDETKLKVINNYIEGAALLKIKIGNSDKQSVGIHLVGGPYIGYALSGKVKLESGGTSTEDKIEYGDDIDEQDRMDFGVQFGVGLGLGPLSIDARWHQGLKNLSNNETVDDPFGDEFRNVGVSLTVGYYFVSGM